MRLAVPAAIPIFLPAVFAPSIAVIVAICSII
jgi:hypothetical protein